MNQFECKIDWLGFVGRHTNLSVCVCVRRLSMAAHKPNATNAQKQDQSSSLHGIIIIVVSEEPHGETPEIDITNHSLKNQMELIHFLCIYQLAPIHIHNSIAFLIFMTS